MRGLSDVRFKPIWGRPFFDATLRARLPADMSLIRLRAAVPCALLLALFAAAPARAQTAPPVPWGPAPVPVEPAPATTAVVVLDITTQTCSSQPNCLEFVPRVASLL